MKDRIAQTLGHQFDRFSVKSHPIILVDWKNITNENLKVYSELPVRHLESGGVVNGVILYNELQYNTHIDAFAENALNYSKKRRSKQCECIVYPCNANVEEWVLFIETKYANNISLAFDPQFDYPNCAIRQIRETVQFFRDKNIIAQDKIVNAMISFPNLGEAFNSFVFRDENSILDIFLSDGIIIRATNYARIIDDIEIELMAEA